MRSAEDNEAFTIRCAIAIGFHVMSFDKSLGAEHQAHCVDARDNAAKLAGVPWEWIAEWFPVTAGRSRKPTKRVGKMPDKDDL